MEISKKREMNQKNSPKQYDAILMDKTKVKLLMVIKKKDKYKGKTWSRCINLRLALKWLCWEKHPQNFFPWS